MPGKHAPESPSSFYLSVARAALGVAMFLGTVVAVVVLLVSRGGDDVPPLAGAPVTTTPATSTVRPTTTATALPTVDTSPSPSARPRSKVTIVVLNGTRRNGLAGRVRDELEAAGYNVVRVGNADAATRTTIFYRSNAKADAEALLDRYPDLGRIRAANSSSARDALITIVLGTDYP